MLAVAGIVFRETLEAALIVSVAGTASIGVPGRTSWATIGVAGGVPGTCLVALFAASIAAAFFAPERNCRSGIAQRIPPSLSAEYAALVSPYPSNSKRCTGRRSYRYAGLRGRKLSEWH